MHSSCSKAKFGFNRNGLLLTYDRKQGDGWLRREMGGSKSEMCGREMGG
jgi:hypothetical protein